MPPYEKIITFRSKTFQYNKQPLHSTPPALSRQIQTRHAAALQCGVGFAHHKHPRALSIFRSATQGRTYAARKATNERSEAKFAVTHWGAPEVVAGRTKGRVHTSNGECAAVGQGGAVSSGAVVEAQERDRERGIRHNTTAPTPPEHRTDRRANGGSGRAEGGATHRGTGCDARDTRPLPYWRQDARRATRAVRRDAERSLDPPRARPPSRAQLQRLHHHLVRPGRRETAALVAADVKRCAHAARSARRRRRWSCRAPSARHTGSAPERSRRSAALREGPAVSHRAPQ